MQWRFRSTVVALAMTCASQPALACRVTNELNLPDVKDADLVVVGRISNYEVIRDNGYYARFAVQVEEVLIGNAGESVAVRWDNSTFALPDEMGPGPFLIALRAPSSETSASPTMPEISYRKPNLMTVLQAACSGGFIFEISSDEARVTRDILAINPR